MKKRLLSLIMAVMMVVVLVVPAAAATTDPASGGTVTVYVTYGLFTKGGYDTVAKAPKAQEYNSDAAPTSNKINSNFYINAYTLSINTIKTDYMATTQGLYGVPDTSVSYFKTPNLVDAILAAFFENGIDITDPNVVSAGWDDHPVRGNPGAYINYVAPQYPVYHGTTQETMDGVQYNVYSGEGWNIACGTSASNIKALDAYGTSTALEDGMIIVFDFSPYLIYDVL